MRPQACLPPVTSDWEIKSAKTVVLTALTPTRSHSVSLVPTDGVGRLMSGFSYEGNVGHTAARVLSIHEFKKKEKKAQIKSQKKQQIHR